MKTQLLKKTILTTGLISLLTIGSAHAIEEAGKDIDRSYVDPITGETKQAEKLLSEMSDTEKALLSNEEYQALKDLEARIKAEMKDKAKGE